MRCENCGFLWRPKTRGFYYQSTKVCKAFTKFELFFSWRPGAEQPNIIHCPTSKQIFLGTNRNIEKASHALLAYHLLNDRLYLVCLEVGGNAEDGNLVNQGLHALKKRKNCENFTHYHNLCFISFTVYFSMAHVGRLFRKVPYFVDSYLNDGPTFHEMT